MRGQTTLDFAIGISVFLITAMFVFAFVPGVLQPFTQGAQEETVVADRVASQLAKGSLAKSEVPYVLAADCTTEFFRTDTTGLPVPDDRCRFNQDTDLSNSDVGLPDRIGLTDRQRVNVTISGDVGNGEEHLCLDTSNGEVVGKSSGNCDVRFAIGDAPPEGSTSVISSRRAVAVDGYDATLIVKVW
jgi:hypothetical protein